MTVSLFWVSLYPLSCSCLRRFLGSWGKSRKTLLVKPGAHSIGIQQLAWT